jgi:pilus assembly protein FimV
MRMPRFTPSIAFAALLCWLAPEAMALGFGRVSESTVLGQALSFRAGVVVAAGEYLVAECVSATVFAGDNQLPSSAVRIAIEPGAGRSDRVIRVRSNSAIDEPVVTVIVQITCPSRLARKFVLFADPPAIGLARADVEPEGSGSAPAQARRSEATAVAVSTAPGPVPKGGRSAATPRPRRTTPAAVAVPREAVPDVVESARAARTAALPRVVQAPASQAGAHLKLVPAEGDASRERLNLRISDSLVRTASDAASAAAPAASVAEAQAEQRAPDRERIQAMEDSLTKMRADAQATQANLAQLQLRLREAEAQSDSNLTVFLLAALSAALAAVVALLLWRRRAEHRAAAQWWAPPAADTATAGDAAADERSGGKPVGAAAQHQAERDDAPLVETTASPMLLDDAHTRARSGPETLPSPADERPVEMSVEELIDLEQQAEFFVVLGQEDAAIDLLMGHLRGSGSANPLAYLKLMEIHHRRGDRDAYELIRERFNRRFNTYAQDWQSDLQQGRSLLDYPKVIARLVSLWAKPEQTMQALEASLLRLDPGSATFDLPAYRELLFLYAVARDLAEHDARSASVDVLLPLDDAPPAATRTPAAPVAAHPAPGAPSVDLDLDVGRLDPGADGRPSQFDTGFGSMSGSMPLAGAPGRKPVR